MKFTPLRVDLFMGGKFEMPDQVKTVGQLRKWLKDVDAELAGWGDDDHPISEVWMNNGEMAITLADGISQ